MEIMDQIKHFIAVAKEVNFDPVALYAKEPLIMQILAGVVLFIVLVIILVIKNKMHHATANKALQNMDSYIETFDEYQANLQKILKTIKGAKSDFIESLQAKKEDYYKEQLQTLRELPLEEKIPKYQAMAALYAKLADTTRDEELREFYAQKAAEILDEKLLGDITEYMQSFNFTPEDVVVLEDIVAYANSNEERGEAVLNVVMDKLKSVDFGSDLERYNFVQNLDAQKLGSIYEFCKEQQEKLFEDGERVVSAEVLEYLLENGQKEKVLAYIKALKVPTHLQELYYRFFNQKGLEELDFAFIANPLEINEGYADYIESLFTANWRDESRLDAILQNDNITKVVGHDRVRQVIERIDALRAEQEENEKLQEALSLAKEAHAMALEAKELVALQKKKSIQETETVTKEEETQSISS